MKNTFINTRLYYLLTAADGTIDKKEVEMGDKMIWHEAISKEKFTEELRQLESYDSSSILTSCIEELKTFNKNDQINCLAWMCLIANADGFMDKNEWQLIYLLYHKQLGLDLNEITSRQRELHRLTLTFKTALPVMSESLNYTNSLPAR